MINKDKLQSCRNCKSYNHLCKTYITREEKEELYRQRCQKCKYLGNWAICCTCIGYDTFFAQCDLFVFKDEEVINETHNN